MSVRVDARRIAALAVGLVGLVVAGVLIGQEQRTGTTPTAPPRSLDASTPAQLDTVGFDGRVIVASLDGWVSEVSPNGRVWLGSDAQAFPVALPDTARVDVEDRLLVTGRLRGRGSRRWLDAHTWTHVQGMAE